MVNKVRTLDFLPEIFKTETNSQFLRGTLDVLTSQPNLRRVQGFIGEKYGYSIEPQDRYVVEPTKARRDYQLDPSVVFLKPQTQTAQDFIDYTGIVQAIKNQGGVTSNNQRLFNNQFYSWDPFVDLDKLVNYSQYYWLPNGPDAVPVSTEQVFLTDTFVVTQSENGYQFQNLTGTNPIINLIRGGTYQFVVSGTEPFWIQGVPGLTGYAPGSNVNTREVLGVTNNGISEGVITFTVPAQDAQNQYTQLPGNLLVDVVTSLQYSEINGQTLENIGEIDGIVLTTGKTLMFYDNGDPSTQTNFYTVTLGVGNIVTLAAGLPINNNEKITVQSGLTYSGRNFFRDSSGLITLVPYISSILDTLWYQGGTEALSLGKIRIVDSNANVTIYVDDILGKKNYVSPNGVTFTNGLKVEFQGNVVPEIYKNKQYYVEGVGQSIALLPVSEYIAPEISGEGIYNPYDLEPYDTTTYDAQLFVPVSPEYLTVSRNSRDRNAWTRANRWFHQNVLNETIASLGYVTQSPINTQTRAQRPIVEFRGNLRLFNSGVDFLTFVTLVAGPNITDAFSQISGQTTATVPLVDGQILKIGDRVIFPHDTDPSVRKHVYTVDLVPDGTNMVYTLNPLVEAFDLSVVVAVAGSAYIGTNWWYSTETLEWTQGQQKDTINQAPLYNIFNANDVSLANNLVYTSSDFAGTKLFSYTVGTGQDDPVLGFPLKYSSASTLGDIEFTVNINQDIFNYSTPSGSGQTDPINIGFVHYSPRLGVFEKLTGWVPAAGESYQYQVFEFPVTLAQQSEFVCDVPAKTDTVWNKVQVYYNDSVLNQSAFTTTIDNTLLTTTITLQTPATLDDKVTVLVLSDYVSKTAYYDVPSNLENNPFNTNIASVSVGDLRNQYRSIFTNVPDASGQVFGDNNYHDLGNVTPYGTAIIQNSASMVLPGVFLRKSSADIYKAIQFNSEQYSIFKQLVIDLAYKGDYSIYQYTNEILDNILYEISKIKQGTTAFFWSDMVPARSPYISNTYNFNADTTTATFTLSQVYDYANANYNGILIYKHSQINGRNVSTQLLRNVDYTVSDVSPSVTVNTNIAAGDQIVVNEYNQTYGSYCPNTPSKMGLYELYVPQVILDTSYTTPTYFIQGHDGSYNKLYGNYDASTGLLDDFRDSILLEFETRIYNNVKVSGAIPLTAADIIPGEFRTTEYSWSEILDMYSTNFLNWVGANNIDYKAQVYNVTNQFSYNYNQSSDKLTGDQMKQGYWRGIYRWVYDCDNPAQFPWQMLGLSQKPTWWEDRYGAAPYTSDNLYLWQDLADGYVWNDGAPYVAVNYRRPELLQCIPVDGAGELVSPLQSIVGLYNRLTFQRDWVVGDGGPAESAYIKSSTWPFDLMRLLAITKPAKFFNLFVDRDLYKYDSELDQYLYENRYHLDPRTVEVYGNGTSKNSYINWVVDYNNQRGANGYNVVTTLLSNLDVRLTYNMAGFTAKEYLKFLVETATPNSRNTSLLIPDESYQVLLYNNVPEEQITYSSVVIQKTERGWKVYGNSQNRQYFTVYAPKTGLYTDVVAGNVSVKVSTEYYTNKTLTIPYGTLFYSLDAVSEFLIDYGRYLTGQGMLFEDIIGGTIYDWTRMAQEFLVWAQQDWEIGSVINLNPSAKNFTVDRPGLVVQPLTIQDRNFILNQNLLPLQTQDTAIVRDNTAFNVSILTEGDTVGYTNLELSSIEHAIVFDNYTVFNDTIYNLTTGLRQPRLLLQGYKTADWQGYVDTSGFILNEDNVQEWQPNVKYPKGVIVTYKDFYWTAVKLIEPAAEFKNEDWLKTDYDQIKTGLLPNPSTNAYESLYYYDTTRANLERDADLLSYSLIGFRPRQYLADADLSDTTQINVYKNIVREKGTNLIANAFRKAELVQGRIDYDIKENWALKVQEFGAVLSNNFVEFILDQSKAQGNPTLIGFTQNGAVADVQQSININEFTNWERPVTTANFLPEYTDGYSDERGIPTAGYVNLNDTKFQEFIFTDLNADTNNIRNIYRNDVVWLANNQGTWNVYAAASTGNQVVSVTNLLNALVQVRFLNPHGLSKNDLLAIVNFDVRVNGFYTVVSVLNDYEITISLVLDATVNTLVGTGAVFQFVSRRFEQPADADNSLLPYSAWSTNKIWADYDTDQEWAVYGSSPVFRETAVLGLASGTTSGVSVAYNSALGTVSADGAGNLYINNTLSAVSGGYGKNTKVLIAGSVLYVSSPEQNSVTSYAISSTGALSVFAQPLSVAAPDSIAASDDNLWLYVGNSVAGSVKIYALNQSTNDYALVNTISTPVSSSGWGLSLATGIDGRKLIAGAPYENSSGVIQSGAAYVFSRHVERFYANGSTASFTIGITAPNSIAYVYVNDVLQTSGYTFNGTLLSFSTAPADGAIVTVSTGYVNLLQRLQSDNLHQGGLFGISVDTNRYGAQMIVGCPYELASVDNAPNVEGAAYVYTNSGQQYGVTYCSMSGTQSGTIYVDGYRVNFSGTATDIVDQINQQTPTNIVAELTEDGAVQKFIITVTPDTPETIYDIIDVTGTQAALQNLGIITCTKTQVITNPDLTASSQFGQVVQMNERNGLVISGPVATRQSPTTFDFTNNCVQDDTIFDNDSTFFIDVNKSTGVVYEFDYLPAANESIYNPGQYVFGQYITSASVDDLNSQPLFGSSLAYASGVIVVGSPQYFANSVGYVCNFNTNWIATDPCEVNQSTSWYVDKKPLAQVNINALNGISIYNNITNETLEWLDYIDPVQGKLLGAVQTNIDHMTPVDPAGYGNNDIAWGAAQVGTTWLDLTTIKLVNYHQPEISYNAKNWGKAFPGSTADIYTWVESDVEPIEYSGSGFPTVFDRYVAVNTYDGSTNSVRTRYYFWVKFYDFVPPGKTLSPGTLTQYLLNPLSSGIGFLSPITTNIVALNNANEYIAAASSSLHLGFRTGPNQDEKHTEWALIREGEAEDFLQGFYPGLTPRSQYLKYIESFVGYDQAGNPVPDPRLPPLTRYGMSFKPRQSMFVDRNSALENYLTYANELMIQYPIAESKNLSYLKTSGVGFNTQDYWEYVDWWAPGFDNNTKPVLEVANVTELQTISNNQLLVGNEGLFIALEDGLVVKVANTSSSNSEFYVYNTETGWTRIGLTNGTIQFLNSLWQGPFGWNSSPFDATIWDETPIQPTYWIIRWINEFCYTNELDAQRNLSLILMFKYIQSNTLEQQNYLPWLNKTSLIDVKHRVRDLYPYKKFQRDNQEFLAGYLNEVKPYHVYIKDFVFSYDGMDTYLGDVTDFDLPSRYISDQGTFETPRLVYQDTFEPDEYTPNDEIWANPLYSQWFQNYGLSVSNQELGLVDVTVLDNYMTDQSTTLTVKNSRGLPWVGYIVIGDEKITYEGIDYVNNALVGVERGADGSVATQHWPGEKVKCQLPSVVVLDPGRAYSDPPRVMAYIDLGIYPTPREEAVLRPIMANDRLIGIDVVNPGSGYPVKPEIYITPSQESTFSNSAFDLSSNTIYIPDHPYQTGDSVLFLALTDSVSPLGLKSNTYYYVKVIDSNNVALFDSYRDSVSTAEISSNDGRIEFINQGSGSDFQLGICAQAVCFTSGWPVREFNISLKFDRVSYTSKVTQWQSGTCYAGVYTTTDTAGSGSLASSSDPSSAGGVTLNVLSAVANADQNTVLTVSYSGAAPGQINGQQIVFYTDTGMSWINPASYYVKVTSPTQVELYQDPLFKNPVAYADFDTSTNIGFLNNPFYFDQSLVMYSGKLWRCVVSNNDTEFNILKWEIVKPDDAALTDADRVMAFYNPTPSMPGRDLKQILAGVTYPNSTFRGADFILDNEPFSSLPWDVEGWSNNSNAERFLDTKLESPGFTSSDDTYYDVQGGEFADGYGPEELVPGLLTDGLNLNVTTKPGSTWPLTENEGWDEGFYGIGRWSPDLYDHSGFNIHQFDAVVDGNNQISFADLVGNPVTLVIFAQTSNPTDSFARQFRVPALNSNYTIDWFNKTITINSAYLRTVTLTVVLYEFGNGSQMVRSNNSVIPLRTVDTHSELLLNVGYINVTIPSSSNYYGSACVYVNGRRIPYYDEVAGATEWYTVEPEINGPLTRIVFNSLYSNDTDYVTFVINGGESGVSIPQTQTIVVTNPFFLTYDLDYFMGDDNPTNVIVEWNGLRLYNLLPNQSAQYSTPLISGYGVPIAAPDIPSFNTSALFVEVGGNTVPTSQYVTNFDPATLSACGLDGEWNSQYGYLDIGVPINTESLYVVFDPVYWPSVPSGTEVVVTYAASVVGEPYTITVDGQGRGQISLNPGLGIVAGDTITVTSFNRTDQQSLVTQPFADIVVTQITTLNNSGPAPVITTTNPHGLSNNDQVLIDSVDGSWKQSAFVQVVSPTQLALYNNYACTVPATVPASYAGSGAYVWNALAFALDQPNYRLYNTQRLWVTIDNIQDSTGGYHLDHNVLRLYDNTTITTSTETYVEPNILGILQEITVYDQVTVLSMVPAETPAELNFRVNVTKSNVQTAWRTNGFTQTYLTDTTYSTGRFDDVLYVQDASKLVEVQNFTVSPDVNNVAVVAGITANQVTSIKIVDSSLNLITDYTLNPAEVNGTEYVTTNNSVLNILINQSYTGPLAVQLAIGNKIIVQSEQIEFTSVDLESVPNRVTGLKRGQNTTITNTVFNKYSTVQSVLNRDLMLEEQYAYSWYDEYAPLQLNNTPAALFLQQQNP